MQPLLTAALIVVAAGRLAAQTPDVTALMARGSALTTANKLDSALLVYQQAMKAAPQDHNVHESIGSTLDLMGRYAEARSHLTKALELAPTEAKPGVMRTIATSYAFEGKASDAATYERQAYDAAVAGQAFDVAAGIANEMARIYLETGDADHALEWYRMGHDIAAKIPTLSDTAKTLWAFRWEHAQARIAARRGNAAEAQKHVAAAKTSLDTGLIPEQARYFPYLGGYVAFYGGDYRAAIAQLTQADQRDPFILAMLAQAHEKLGDAAKATDYWRAVMAIPAHTLPGAFSRPLARKKVG
jgi:tetratricopeptide (TPR) repeat protein